MSHDSDATRDATRRRLVLAGLGSAALPAVVDLRRTRPMAKETLRRSASQKSSTPMIWAQAARERWRRPSFR